MEEDVKDLESAEQEYPIDGEYFIPIDISNLDGAKINKKKFQEGLDDFSYYSGVISVLMNSGISAQDAMSWVLNDQTLKSNKEMQLLVNENNIVVAKIQLAKAEAQIL